MFVYFKELKKNLFTDTSLWFLLLANLITIFFAIKEGWSLSVVIWIYWYQSVIIGITNFFRILQLKEFSTKGFTINRRQVQPTQGTKVYTALFFALHYGYFHFSYYMFLSTNIFPGFGGITMSPSELKFVLGTSFLFLINHLFSYVYNRPIDNKKQNIGLLMFYPYARIIPMHLIIGATSFFGALPFFLVLKTFADCLMHVTEHNMLRKGEGPDPEGDSGSAVATES